MPESEFSLIKTFFSDPEQCSRREIILGIGDDCALLTVDNSRLLAISIDTLVQGVHFPDNTSPEAIAHKALAVNLSDLAAMGAEPAWFTLALTLPSANQAWLRKFSQSLFKLAGRYNLALIGGDTTRGPLSITIQICGYLPLEGGIRRSGAKAGDLVCVTGPLGAASLGLDIVLHEQDTKYDFLSERLRQLALQALNFPNPRVMEGRKLRSVASAGLDISDGLLADLGHILEASGVGAEIALEKIPVAEPLAFLPRAKAIEKALTGGDDYELCFTLSPTAWEDLRETHSNFVRIGKITHQQGLRMLDNGNPANDFTTPGFDHFIKGS